MLPPVRRRPRRGRGARRRRGRQPSRRRRSSPASTTAGCSTRPWSAATSPCRWPPSAPCSGSPTNCPRSLRPRIDGPDLSDARLAALVVVVGLVLLAFGAVDRCRRRQLAVPAGTPRRLAGRRPRADHPPAHGAGDRPHPRLHGVRGAGHAMGAGGAGQRARHRTRRRRPPGPAAAARPENRGVVAGAPAGRRPGPAPRHPPAARRRRIVRATWPGCWSPSVVWCWSRSAARGGRSPSAWC